MTYIYFGNSAHVICGEQTRGLADRILFRIESLQSQVSLYNRRHRQAIRQVTLVLQADVFTIKFKVKFNGNEVGCQDELSHRSVKMYTLIIKAWALATRWIK